MKLFTSANLLSILLSLTTGTLFSSVTKEGTRSGGKSWMDGVYQGVDVGVPSFSPMARSADCRLWGVAAW